MSPIENERTKLTATAINNLALAFAVAGFVAPLVGYSFGLSSAPPASAGTIVVSFVWLTAAIVLHIAARRFLRNLRP